MTRKTGPDHFYQVLGVNPEATQEKIKRRYRQLVKEVHPDHNAGRETQAIRRINEAYEILSKVKSRKRYDSMVFRRVERGMRSVSPFSGMFNYERTRHAYEAYLARIRMRRGAGS